ncbi:MAG: CYTH domain-containing protein [Oscillospiraceae bacterium]|nr:CYTH domain-containing protein [Oscillospiraceae bacterium]
MASEIELKYVPQGSFSRETLFSDPEIKGRMGEIKKISMETEYLDTIDGKASSLGITLRRRCENGESVIYAKSGKSTIGALSIRGEWRVASDDVKNAAKLLAEEGAPTEQLFGKELCITAKVSFTRYECTVTPHSGFSFSLSYDEGVLGRDHNFCEIELELLDGECEELLEFGEKLAEKLSLIPETRSKYKRALLYM